MKNYKIASPMLVIFGIATNQQVGSRNDKKKFSIIFAYYFLLFTCLYAGSSTTYTTDMQFNAGNHNNTITFGSGESAFVSLENSFYDITNLTKPSSRKWHSITYNKLINKIVLFGGFDGNNALNDTWIYNPNTEQWTKKTTINNPPVRYGHILVANGTNKVILFGGYDGNSFFNDTWEYDLDLNDWTQIITVSTPPVLGFSSADYDVTNDKIILFGGQSETGLIKYSGTWIYHLNGSSWTQGAFGPSARKGASASYNSEYKKILIFGGEGNGFNNYLSDTWTYNYSDNIWTNSNPSGSVPPRSECSIFYDSRNKRSVLYGGRSNTGNYDDIWFYSFNTNIWSTSQPSTSVSSRYGFGVSYINSIEKAFLFGGNDGYGLKNDFYNYVFRSSGIYTTIYFDTPFSTELNWLTIEAPTRSGVPVNTILRFQIASSVNNVNYSDFVGWDGTANTYYEYINSPMPISNSNDNKRYLKLRFFFDTTEPPISGKLNSVTVNFNRSPNKPSLNFPINGISTNDTTPDFQWYSASDDDGDSLTYKIEVDDNSNFLSPIIMSSNIAAIEYIPIIDLGHGEYFWRISANDGLKFSAWSSTFTFLVDLIPPDAVASFSAVIGSYNGTINLSWNAPGNNGSIGNIISGKYYIRFATYSVLTETDWQNSFLSEETISKYLIIQNETQAYIVDNLNDGTSYYFSVKTQDDAGNISGISSVSPICMTNAAPIVEVKSPNGSEIFWGSKVISWESRDPYPFNDTRTFSVYDSSDGINFSTLIASNLPNNTTYYIWNTKNARNSTQHKIRVVATDSRGLESYDISDNVFTVNNNNVQPIVVLNSLNYPERITGNYTINFTVSDENLSDNHRFTILASTNSGFSYDVEIIENITATSYVWNTVLFPNSPKYRIKIIAIDDGNPNLSGEDKSENDFEVNNDNKTPSTAVLVLPLNDSFNTIGTLKFVWQESIDPNPEDYLTYTLYYSTNELFIGGTIISGLTDVEYVPKNILENIKYYWKVVVTDPFGYSAISNIHRFTASWSRDDSDDGNVRIEITEGLPVGHYVKVENTDTNFSIALKNSISDRLIKCFNESAYKIQVYDKNNSPQNLTVKGNVRFKYKDDDNNGFEDETNIKVDNIRIAHLNESKNNWEFPKSLQVIDKKEKTIKVNIEHLSYFTTVASVVPKKAVSNIVNFPNPFNPEKESTTIKYVLTTSHEISIRIFNLVGDSVYDNSINAGDEGAIGSPEGYTNEIIWDGKNGNGVKVANGVYILEIKSGKDKDIRKIAIIK